MTKFFLIIIVCLPLTVLGQNFLLNGGFEDENTCTEFNVECAPEAWQTNDDGFSNYFKDSGRAHGGLHCMAIEAGHAKKSFRRTFIRSQLVCGLRKGGQYQIDLFVKSPHSILDSLGIYFTSYDFLFDSRPLQTITPVAYFGKDNTFAAKDTNWQKVNLNYTATGEEAFLSIANFSKRDITGSTGIPLENNFFVFIDDVTLTPTDSRERLCDDWTKRKQEIYEQDERHSFLRKKIKEAKEKPLEPVFLTVSKLVVVDTLILPDVLFASGKSQLQSNANMILDDFIQKRAGHTIDSIVVEGHTDNKGSNELNEHLSLERAKTVGNYLIDKSIIKPSQLVLRGWAFSKPVADNNTEEGRQRNRRVEVFVYEK
ncbi:MAG: OmpA family protein [Chitinophagaceae bacterium]